MRPLIDHADVLLKLPRPFLKNIDATRGETPRSEVLREMLLAAPKARIYPAKVKRPEEGTPMRELYDSVVDARKTLGAALIEVDAPVEDYLPVKAVCGALRELCEKIEDLGR